MKKIIEAIVTKKPVSYQGKTVLVRDHKMVGADYILVLSNDDVGVFEVTFTEKQLNIFLDAPMPVVVKTPTIDIMKDPMIGLFQNLAKGLESDFDRIAENPEYIPQAKQRADTVKTMIEMVKTQATILKDS